MSTKRKKGNLRSKKAKKPKGSKRIENAQVIVETTEKRHIVTRGEDGEMAVWFYLHNRGRLVKSICVETRICLNTLELVVLDAGENIVFVQTTQIKPENKGESQ